MSEHGTPFRSEHRGLLFLLALERGDADTVADLWREAERDADLEALLVELTLARDAGAAPPRPARPLPPLPELIVRHDTHSEEGEPDAGPVKKAR